MKTKQLITLILSALLLASCYQEYPDPGHFGKPINVTASIEGSKTRAVDKTWTNGDAIGIYMKKTPYLLNSPALSENVKYVTADGSSVFTPADPAKEITIPANGTEVDFIAYYPYRTSAPSFSYAVNVSDQSKQEVIDLMYSNNVTSLTYANPAVNLNFVHQLSKIILNISSDKPDYVLTGLRAKITNVGLTAAFSLIDGTLSAPISTGNIFLKMSADGLFAEGILLPENNVTAQSLILIVGEDSYTLPLSSVIGASSLNKSTKYNIDITLKPATKPAVQLNAVSITDWITQPTSASINQDNTPYLGSQSNPYTIADAIANQGEKNVWVKGFIVGYYPGTSYTSFVTGVVDVTKISNIALAQLSTETDPAKTFSVNLLSGTIQNVLNLQAHPENLGKEVILNGDLEAYYGVAGIKNLKKAIFNDKVYP